MVRADVLAEQIRYYRARVGERRAGRDLELSGTQHAELRRLRALLDRVPLGDDVLEFAAGTGRWTAQLRERATSVTAIDAAAEALEVNRRSLGEHDQAVEFIVADLFTWRPTRTWDSAVGFFWLCKIPDDRLHSFLETVAHVVRPHGTFFFGDKTGPAGTPPASELETRTLSDGETFTIVDRPRSSEELRDAFTAVGLDIEVVVLGQHFTAVTGNR